MVAGLEQGLRAEFPAAELRRDRGAGSRGSRPG